MLERGWGRVINVASMAGLAGAPYVAAYTASKHALVGLTRALAARWPAGASPSTPSARASPPRHVWSGARNIAARTGRGFEDAVAAMARLIRAAA